MNFVSYPFLVFFAVVSTTYFLLPWRWQNRLLLAASYFFYGWWDWRFLGLMLASSLVDFYCGPRLAPERGPGRRRFLLLSAGTNLGILGLFKYFDFFSANFERVLEQIGFNVHLPILHLVLPLGISFYTFQTMSYSIDVYRGKVAPTHRLLDFLLYVSFFPQLVAGPIERASHLLPQMLAPRPRSWSNVASGCQLMLVGFFKKMVIADNLAIIVNDVYRGDQTNGFAILVGTYAFAVQIYCDFSGYTDIARGSARILGFDICENFRLPYFATNPREFWQRWHISLSTWLRDYLYVPIGGNRGNRFFTARNLMITMLLGGLWHGASGHFVAWGAYHGALLVAHRMLTNFTETSQAGTRDGRTALALRAFGYFQLTCVGWLLFRAESMGMVRSFLYQLVNFSGWQWYNTAYVIQLSLFALPLALFQAYQYRFESLEVWTQWRPSARAAFYVGLFYAIVFFGSPEQSAFIYFQF